MTFVIDLSTWNTLLITLAVELKACFNSFLGLKDICQCHNLDLGRHELKKSEWAKWMGDKCWFINKYQSRSYFMGLTHTILPTHNTIKKMNLREEFSCQNEIWYCRIFYGWIVDTCVFSRVKTFFSLDLSHTDEHNNVNYKSLEHCIWLCSFLYSVRMTKRNLYDGFEGTYDVLFFKA